MPSEKVFAEMDKFNEELAKAGMLLAAEGLQPTSKDARVKFSGSKRIVTDGPFAETKELIAGFWLWQVNSKEEVIAARLVKVKCHRPRPAAKHRDRRTRLATEATSCDRSAISLDA